MKNTILLTCFSFLLFSCKKENNVEINDTENWMHDLLKNDTASIAFKDITLPGAHDAGTYFFNECTFGANECNTRTQTLDMKQQLYAGMRIFDIRPNFHNGVYYTQHATDCDGLGCYGATVESMFTDVNDFLEHHNELVILLIGHFCHTSYDETGFANLVNQILGDKIYKEDSIESFNFIHRPLKHIIPTDNLSGKVVMVYEGAANTTENRINGIFNDAILRLQGGWSNSSNFPDLKQKQLANFSSYNGSSNSLFQISWQITQSPLMAVNCELNSNAPSIIQLADRANAQLVPILDSLQASGDIRKGRIPNIIWVDRADKFATRECIRLSKLNVE